MANKINNKSHSLAVKPYDDSQWNDINLYNKLPYKWDEELYHDKKAQLYSGNIIKSNSYKIKHPLTIKNR